MITTAEGGVCLTNNAKIANKIENLSAHGITRDPNLMTKETDGGWYYQQIELGFNYRMNDLQAALGIAQMKRLDKFIAIRHSLKKRYDELLKDLPLITPVQSSDSYSSLHLYPIQLKLEQISKSQNEIFDELRQSGVGVNLHYIPIHMQPYFENMGFKKGDFPIAEDYYTRVISVPIYQNLIFETQDKVVSILKKILK